MGKLISKRINQGTLHISTKITTLVVGGNKADLGLGPIHGPVMVAAPHPQGEAVPVPHSKEAVHLLMPPLPVMASLHASNVAPSSTLIAIVALAKR